MNRPAAFLIEPAALIALATCGEFTLLERPARAGNGWRALKLERRPRRAAKKNNWWLGWNGERLSRNSDTGKLAKQHPEVLKWVIDVLCSQPKRET